MILTRLKELAERLMLNDKLPPPGYNRMPIVYEIKIDIAGNLLQVVSQKDAKGRSIRHEFVPNPGVRAAGEKAGLLADTAEYILQKQSEKNMLKPEKLYKKHSLLLQNIQQCSEAVKHPAIQAVRAFYANYQPEQPDIRFEEIESGDNVIFAVEINGNTIIPTQLPEVQKYWSRSLDSGTKGTCLLCGDHNIVLMEGMPLNLKRIPNGQPSGVQIISANDPAFESYGLKRSLIAPLCRSCAEKTHHAINYLTLEDDLHITLRDKLVFLFWAKTEMPFSIGNLLNSTTEEDVKLLLTSYQKGKQINTDMNVADFYALCLAGSGGRAVLTEWFETTLSSVQQNLQTYFARQEIKGEKEKYLPLWMLTAAMERQAKDNRKDLWQALLKNALYGTVIPNRVLLAKISSYNLYSININILLIKLGDESFWILYY
jgi:CRISPR-associated protein Csd1